MFKSQILIVWSSLALARVLASSLQTAVTGLVCPLSVCVQVAVDKSQILIVWSWLALARVWASSLQTANTKLVCPSSVFCTVKVSWARGGRVERGEGGWGFPPVLKVAPRRFHGFWDKKDSNILALDFPARPLHKRAPHRDGQRSSFILLNSFPKVLSSYLHSSFSSTSSAPPGTSASNAWLKHFKHAIARLLGRRKSLKMSDTFSPSGPILLPLKDICRSLLLSNFCEHLTGSHRLTLHHQSLHHTTPIALAASLPIKVHPKPMNFRPRMSCSCSFTSCHKQSRIDRRCFWHRERTGAM